MINTIKETTDFISGIKQQVVDAMEGKSESQKALMVIQLQKVSLELADCEKEAQQVGMIESMLIGEITKEQSENE